MPTRTPPVPPGSKRAGRCRAPKGGSLPSTNDLLVRILDDAFDGHGWQGPANLKNTVERMTLDQLTTTATTLGYSAWGIVLHCAYWKWVVADVLLSGRLDAFPRSPKDFPGLPERPDEAAWQRDFGLLLDLHERVKTAVLDFPEEWWDEDSPPPHDPYPYIKRVYGLAAHDVYHTAQIRNMGIPGLE